MPLGPWFTEDDKRAVMAVLDEGDLMSGKRVAELECQLADYFGKRHAVCVSSGTAALECAFVATGEGYWLDNEGFIAIVSAAKAAGKPARFIEDHLGVRCDVLGVQKMAVTRVHDCAHRFDKGAAHADVSCFSMNVNKFIAAGGGLVVTNDSVVAATCRQYRNHGRDGGPEIFREGRNLRMGEIQAALALSQLKRIDEILERRKQVAKWYDEVTGQNIADSRASHFLYPWTRKTIAPRGQRTLADFRLWNSATNGDYCTWLMPIWPMQTREEVEAMCKS